MGQQTRVKERRGLAREIDMTKGRILPQILVFSLPIMVTGVLQLLFNAADLMVVGQFVDDGGVSLAAIGATGSIIHLIINLFMGLATGAGVLMANYFGAKDREAGSRLLHTAMPLSLVSGLVVTVLGIIFSRRMLEAMSTPENCLPLSDKYLVIYFCGASFNMVYNFGAAILRSIGDIIRPLIYLTVGGVLNVIINLIAVICFKKGVEGVAYATIASQGVSAVLVVIALFTNKGFVKLSLKKIRIRIKPLLDIIRIGLPAGLQAALFSISNVIIQSTVNKFGSDCVTGNTIANTIEGFVFTIINSISQSCVTAVGQNYGAKDFGRIKKFMTGCAVFAVIVGTSCGTIVYLVRKVLVDFFNPTEIARDYAYNRLMVMLLSYFTLGIMNVVNNGLRGMGFSVTPMVIVLMGTCVLRIFWIYVIFPLWKTYMNVMLSYPVSWIVTSAVAIVAFEILFGMRRRKYENGTEKGQSAC